MLDALNGWREVMALPVEDKMAVLADPPSSGASSTNWPRDQGSVRHRQMGCCSPWVRSSRPDNEQYKGRTIGEMVEDRGPRDRRRRWRRSSRADELMTGLYARCRGYDDEIWKARIDVLA